MKDNNLMKVMCNKNTSFLRFQIATLVSFGFEQFKKNSTTFAKRMESANTTTIVSNQPMKKKLILLRGISGSGKSTLAKQIVDEFLQDVQKTQQEFDTNTILVFSTDDFFINPTTKRYEFNGAMLGKAHQWNQQRVKQAMQKGQLLIIVFVICALFNITLFDSLYFLYA